MVNQTYVFGNDSEGERARIDALEEFLDPGTIRILDAIGVDNGWHCLEIGAGGGSIASWLAGRVGSVGKVVATDLHTRLLEGMKTYSNMEVRRHDVVQDALPDREFNLIHARLVLEHIPQRDSVWPNLVRSLRPGGWLVVESVDYASAVPVSEHGAMEHAHSQRIRLREFEAAGNRLDYGRHLPRLMREAGLDSVASEGRVFVMEGGSPGARWFRLSMEHLRPRLLGPGKLREEEIDRMLELFADPAWAALSPIIVSCWGRAREVASEARTI
jgi:SAM-dependent methyltransferase